MFGDWGLRFELTGARKRKCDGQRPACGFCAGSGARCEYQENSNEKYYTKRPTSDLQLLIVSVRSEADIPAELVLRLDRLESLIQHQTTVISALSNRLLSIEEKDKNCSPPFNSITSENVRGNSASHTSLIYSSLAGDMSTSIDSRMRYQYNDDPLLIPLGHQTPTGSLLGLERIRSLIGDYSQGFFLFLESERSLQPLVPRVSYSSILERLNARHESTDFLVSSFRTHVHSQFPSSTSHSMRE